MFRMNLGARERTLRVALGGALLAIGLTRPSPAWWGWLGILPVVTGLAAYCPVWDALGISSNGG